MTRVYVTEGELTACVRGTIYVTAEPECEDALLAELLVGEYLV